MTDRELIVAKRVCQYTKALMPPVEWTDGWTTNPRLSAACSAVRTAIYLRCGVYKTPMARKLPDAKFMEALNEVLPEREE